MSTPRELRRTRAGPSGRTNLGLPGARDRAGQATHPTNGRITVWCVISGLAKIQTQAPRKGQINPDFSQAGNKGEDYPVIPSTGADEGGGGSRRASAEFPPSLPPPPTQSLKAGGILSLGLWGGWCLAQKRERGPQKHRWADPGDGAGGWSQGFQEGGSCREAVTGRQGAHMEGQIPTRSLTIWPLSPNAATQPRARPQVS